MFFNYLLKKPKYPFYQFDLLHKQLHFPINKHYPLMQLNNTSESDDEVIPNKTYIIVTTNGKGIMNTFNEMGIEIMDKTCVEEYRIFSIKCEEYRINELKNYEWCVNISKGYI